LRFIHVKSYDSSYFLAVFGTGVTLVSPELADAMQALNDSEECLRSVANAAGDAVISISTKGKITFANKAVERIFGYPADELLGKPISLLIPARFLGKHLEGMEKWWGSARLGKGKTRDLVGKRKNGEEFPAELSFSAWKMRGKAYFTVIVRDVTERMKAQQRIEKLNRCFLAFRTDPNENINSVVALCGELLGSRYAIYNRLDEGMLCSSGRWNTPRDYKAVDKPDGHICYDVIKQETDAVLIIKDLHKTRYAVTDPNVSRYKLRTYLGVPVTFGGNRVGSLCVVYQTNFDPLQDDIKLLELLASAIGIEEVRRRSELRLQDSEEMFRAISASTVDAVILMDEKGRISYWNHAAEIMFGYKNEDVIGEVAFKLLAPGRFNFNHSQFYNLLKNGRNSLQGRVLEFMAVKKDGTEFPVELSISSLQIHGKWHAVVIMRDTSDRKKMDIVLREEEEKYRRISRELESLMRSSAVMLSTTDLRERLKTVAEAVHDQGWGRVVISLRDENLNTIDLVSAGLTAKEEQYLKEHQSSGDVWQKRLSSMFESYRLGEFYYLPWSDPLVQDQFKYSLSSKVPKKGTVDWDPDDLLYVPLKLPDGQTVGIMSMDDPKDGRRPTNESLAPLELFAHQAAVAIENARLIKQVKEYALNLEKMVDERTSELKRSEEKLKSIFAASPDAITATDLNGSIIECNEQTVKIHGYSSREELIGKSVFQLIAKKHQSKAFENMKQTFETGQIKASEYVFVTRDGREFPAELSTSIVCDASGTPIGFVAITKDVTERKRMEQQIFKSERLAAIGQLAGMIGHDLRNPLTGITGAAYYLKTHLDLTANGKTKEMLEIIGKDIAYSNKIISDLLEYSKEMKLDLTDVTPLYLTREALALVRIPRRVRVVELAKNTPLISVDVEKVKRAFVNVIKNAVDAMPKGGTLTIRSRKSDGNLEISFADTGMGMPGETLQRIFTPLFTSKAKGMGFGLAISKRVVEAHGGRITVESTVGEGSTFTLIIPIERKKLGGEKIWIEPPESLLSTTMKA
jgi:PAS domain S-box-containing protein